jgi:microsomal dipeptidase-like Zn-dependent dipeptidase
LEDCLCSEVAGVAVLADGICLDPMCGGEGERGCCLLGEDRPAEGISSACHDGLIETGSCIVDCQCSGPATLGVNSDGICVDPQCGGEGERACCLNEQVELGVANCEPGLIELVGYADEGGDGACLGLVTVGSSSGTCHRFTPCGGEGQRACCAAERPGQPCDPGLTEVPGCSGDCFCGGSLTGVVDDDILGISSGTCVRFEEIGEPGVGYTAPAPSQDCSQRGYADLHMHLFADIAHGGGVLAGEPCPPGSSSYCDETLTLDVNDALSDCYGTDRDLVSKEGDDLHNPENGILPPLCPGFIPDCGSNLFHGDHTLFDDAVGSDLGTFDGSQSNLGVPAFNGWPQWTSTTHQQVYYKWLERAWRGGLRLIVQMAVNNTALCETNKRFRNADCSDSMAFIDEQLQAAYDFQDYIDALAGGPGLGWFRIVLTPAEARSAIAQGKMAVVLAIEVDHLFNCKFPAAECVVVDNQLVSCSFTLDNDVCGDPDDPSKSSEQWVREQVDYYYDVWGVRHMFPIHNFDNSFGGAATWQSAIEVGNRFIEGHWYTTQDECSDEGYAFKLGEDGAVIQFIAGLFGFGQGVEVPIRDEEASCNFWGLFPLGEVLVQTMMDRGMIIDIDHMSNRSLDDTIALAQGFRAEGYPLMASHALFFDLNTPDIRHERMRTPAQLAALNAMGSMVGVMLKDDVLDRDTRGERKTLDYAGSGVNDDCRHSSKTFAQAYKYAVDHMGGRVAMGSDFNGVAGHFGPRFGSDACGGDNFERSKQLKADDRLDYPFVLDQFGTFSKQVSGQKAFDYNVDGLAHVGLLPDFVADLNNVGLSGTDLDPLFQSAEAYIQMWELARGETVRTGCLACSGDIFTGDSDGDGVCNDIDVCPGGNDLVDVNNDGVANLLDFGEIAREFGCLSGCIADINGDGATNLIELQLLATDWLCGTGL